MINRSFRSSLKLMFSAGAILVALVSAGSPFAIASHFSLMEETPKYYKVLSEVEQPIVISNAKENLSCRFLPGQPNTFRPHPQINLILDQKNPLPVVLKNAKSLRVWHEVSGAEIIADSPEIQVMREDCEILMARVQAQINSRNELVLPGKRRLMVAYEENLVEDHSAILNLGEPLHGNPEALMQVKIGKSVYLDMSRKLPGTLFELQTIAQQTKGTARLHPRAASDFGLHCELNPILFGRTYNLALSTYKSGIAMLPIANTRESFSTDSLSECENKLAQLLRESELLDPQNNGETVEVLEQIDGFTEHPGLQINQEFKYQDISFKSSVFFAF